ncbi:MAG: hypothetical protein K6G38_04275 [Gammaproteobacteria bacterium]|nr:hypothetical protein [Gammaproteobacteria bacterium]
MGIKDLFKKKIELPNSLSFEGKNLDYTHIFFNAPNPFEQRENVMTLNGMYHMTTSSSFLIPTDFNEIVYVPYPIGSILSCVERTYNKKLFYHLIKNFKIESNFKNELMVLCFTKLSGEYTIYLNGNKIAYGKNSLMVKIDVTNILNDDNNNLVLSFKENPKDLIIGPSGPIYIESTPKNKIEDVIINLNLKDELVTFNIDAKTPRGKITITTPIAISKTYDFDSGRIEIRLGSIVHWTPDKPFFYQYSIELEGGDYLRGVFPLFEYKLDNIDGVDCFTLNNKPFPIKGLIDDYYYSDSFNNPPSQQHVKFLFDEVKGLNFNSIRKTSFIEIPEYYYSGIVKGLLIAQDLDFYNEDDFNHKLNYLKNFKSIFMVIVHNKNKEMELKNIYNLVRVKFPERLIVVKDNNQSFGDIEIDQNKKSQLYHFKRLSYIEKDEFIEYMNKNYIKDSMNKMVGFYLESLNNPKTGIYNESLTKLRFSKKKIREILK